MREVLEPGELAQTDVENVVRLALGEPERLDELRLGLLRVADDADDLVHVEQHDHAALEHVDAVEHLSETVARASRYRVETEANPLRDDVAQILARGPAVEADHDQVDRNVAFHAGLGKQQVDEFGFIDARGLGFEHQPHRVRAVGFVARLVEHREHQLLFAHLFRCKRFFARFVLRIGDRVDLFQNFPGRRARWQFVHHHLPLAARQTLDVPARAHANSAAARGVRLLEFCARRDDLRAAGEVGSLDVLHEPRDAQLRIANHGNGCRGHFIEVMAWNFRGHAHRDARRAVQQHDRQTRRKDRWLFAGAVVVGDEIDGAHVDLREQHFSEPGQPRFRVSIRGRLVAIARAEIAFAIDQRIAHGEILREAHERVVNGLVSVRMQFAQHLADHGRRFGALRTRAGVGGPHGIKNASLHRLLSVPDSRQCAVLDRRNRVLQVLRRGVLAQRQCIAHLARHGRKMGRQRAAVAPAARRRCGFYCDFLFGNGNFTGAEQIRLVCHVDSVTIVTIVTA